MEKVDLRKDLKQLYSASTKEPSIVDVPEMPFIMIDGMGDPVTSKGYVDTLQAIYSVSFTLKFMIKRGPTAVDYSVMPLEGLWWADNMDTFALAERDKWKWTMMIMQPKYITAGLFKEAVKQVATKKKLPLLTGLRMEKFAEGMSAQIMHVGPYSAEGPTIQRLHDFIKSSGHSLRGKHHEIYMGNPERSAPEKLKTIIRQPFAR